MRSNLKINPIVETNSQEPATETQKTQQLEEKSLADTKQGTSHKGRACSKREKDHIYAAGP